LLLLLLLLHTGRNNSPESNCFVKSTQDLGKFKLAGGWDGVKHKTIR